MIASQQKLDSFISKNKTQFIIPVYQRNYDWESKKECKRLFDDILKACSADEEDSYFIGSIVFIHDGIYTSGVNQLTIIDGQQRLTTISLIYMALYQYALEVGDIDTKEEIYETYLCNKRFDEKLKLRLTENNDKAMMFLLNNGGNEKYGEYSRIIENYRYVKDRLNKNNIQEIMNGLSKLIFVEISLERGKDDPQRIFESLNSTGMDLSSADLIRNYILIDLPKEDQENIYKKYWMNIEKYCTVKENNKSRVSDYIRDYLTMKSGKIPNIKNVHNEYQEKYKFHSIDDIEQELSELKKYAYQYNRLINFSDVVDKDIRQQLKYISKLEINVANPFLLEVLNDYENNIIEKSVLIELLELIQSLVFRRFVVGLPTNSLNKIFQNLYSKVDTSDYLHSVQKALVKKIGVQRFPKNIEFMNSLKDKDVYHINSKKRVYLLDRLENYNNNELVIVDGNSQITIEHIFPQTPDKEWKELLGEHEYNIMINKHLNSIGNLTLSGNNGSLGNKSFAFKRDLKDKGYKASRLFLNKYLSSLNKWDVSQLSIRSEQLISRAQKIWKFPDVVINGDSDNQEINIFDAADPTFKNLEYFVFHNEKVEETKISKMYEYVISDLFENNSKSFFTTDLGEKFSLTEDKSKLRQAVKINSNYYIEGNLDSSSKFERILNALEIFDMQDELYIKYSNPQTKTPAENSTGAN
ncbi:MAG: DUF262 domain-containing protein [Chlorobi bacterium]|nr:DUF262 domain-containing protein [Chlorobiota bacterium]